MPGIRQDKAYRNVVQKTADMVADAEARQLARRHGLEILNITWEDTARYKEPAAGPNISDMTLQVQELDPKTNRYHLTLLPVIRFPNFHDKSCDLPSEKLFLLVGNERQESLKKISLKELLQNLRACLTSPDSWKGERKSLFVDDRDQFVLVSSQACFLPIPPEGMAEFNPVLFTTSPGRRTRRSLPSLPPGKGQA